MATSFVGGLLTIIGTNANDLLHLTLNSAGEILLNGGSIAGNPTLSTTNKIKCIAHSGNDTLNLAGLTGWTGKTVIEGRAGNDVITGIAGNDTLVGGSGRDTLVGGGGQDFLKGSAGNDELRGGAGRDTLVGGSNRDTLNGNASNDRLAFGTGDKATGGWGDDAFIFNGQQVKLHAKGLVPAEIIDRSQEYFDDSPGLLSMPLLLDEGGWGTPIAVSGGYVYWTASGNLYKGQMGGSQLTAQLVNAGGWDGMKIAISEDYLYWTAGGNLYKADLGAGTFAAQTVDLGGWNATHIAVADGSVYWTKNDNLYRANLAQPIAPDLVDSGGWKKAIAVEGGFIYWINHGDLYTAPVSSPTTSTLLLHGGWKGHIAVSNGFIHFANEGGLYKALLTHQPIQRIAFGSCAADWNPTPIWDTIANQSLSPELFLFLGDSIYADRNPDTSLTDAYADPETYLNRMWQKYQTVADKSEFRNLQNSSLVLSTWDDHDYGYDDIYGDFLLKSQSQELFLDFFGVPQYSPQRTQEGVNQAQLFGPPGQRVQVVMLDERYHGDLLGSGPTLLGEDQWHWLEEQLRTPAQVRLIASGIQVIEDNLPLSGTGWAFVGSERQRLYDLIRDTDASGVIFVSGDVHFAEMMKVEAGMVGVDYPLYDLTSSGMNNASNYLVPPDPSLDSRRQFIVGNETNNFGQVEITWGVDPEIRLAVYDVNGMVVGEHTIYLSELQSSN